MTVYELIQELVQYDANKEVVIDFKTNDLSVDVDEDKSEGDTVVIDGEEKTGTVNSLNTFNYEHHKKVHIECEED